MQFWKIDSYDEEMRALGYGDDELAEAKKLLDLSRSKSVSNVANRVQPDLLNGAARALLRLLIAGEEARGTGE